MPQLSPKLVFVLLLTPNLTSAGETDCVPLARFENFTPCSTLGEIVSDVGEPAADIGSGIHIYKYNICGGGTVFVGSPSMDALFYVNYTAPDSAAKNLLAGKPDCPENPKRKH